MTRKQRNEPQGKAATAPVATEFTLADAEAFIQAAPWTAAKWAAGTDARHEYVMVMWDEVDGDEFHAFYRLIREQGYKAKWTNPETGKTYYNRYLEVGEFTLLVGAAVPQPRARLHAHVADSGDGGGGRGAVGPGHGWPR